MEEHLLFQPLLSKSNHQTKTHSSSNKSLTLRLLFITLIALLSLFANHEASKGFEIKILNESNNKRFDLFYESNDKAVRIVQNASNFVEHLLYNNSATEVYKKRIRRVTLRITSENLKRIPTVRSAPEDEFVIDLTVDMTMGEEADVDRAIVSGVTRGMARVWLWDGESAAPMWLIDGLVEYVGLVAGFGGGGGCERGLKVVRWLEDCERKEKGFIRRLNRAIREKWDDWTVEDWLRVEAKSLCEYPEPCIHKFY